ncbi:hypothetical protein PAEAM_54610 [Paenibacillus sp. GM1FR]|nr:hypothetical protein PAEAM_54610 [Paenibacillus sp. GM1FR]
MGYQHALQGYSAATLDGEWKLIHEHLSLG